MLCTKLFHDIVVYVSAFELVKELPRWKKGI